MIDYTPRTIKMLSNASMLPGRDGQVAVAAIVTSTFMYRFLYEALLYGWLDPPHVAALKQAGENAVSSTFFLGQKVVVDPDAPEDMAVVAVLAGSHFTFADDDTLLNMAAENGPGVYRPKMTDLA